MGEFPSRRVVETLLRISEAGETSAYSPKLLAQLCRAWLALDAAPECEVTREDWLENAESFAADLIGQRVRLVATPTTRGPSE